MYYADLLRILALANMKPDADLPTLAEFLAPPERAQTADEIYNSLSAKFGA